MTTQKREGASVSSSTFLASILAAYLAGSIGLVGLVLDITPDTAQRPTLMEVQR